MKKKSIFALIFLLKIGVCYSQIVDASPETQTICSGGSANLTAIVTPGGPGSLPTTSYAISTVAYSPDSYTAGTAVTLSDDSQSGLLPIGFTFCFYGNSYTQFIIGSNNWLGFQAGETSTWVTTTIPNATGNAPRNTIMGAWQDINPGVGGTIKYALYGVAPNRRLSVSWRNVPMFSCGSLYSSQITIFESTNIIETRIANKPLCTSWNSGNAVHGLHNATGTAAAIVPGRNNTQWVTTNETKRFTPNGIATYTINWYVLPSNTFVGTGSPITVTPPAGQPSTFYYASITGTSGCGAALSSTDTVVVLQTIVPALTASNNGPICSGNNLSLSCLPSTVGATYSWTGPGGFVSSLQNPAIPLATVANSGIYTVTITLAGCVGTPVLTTVTINPTPATPIATGSTPICEGTTLNLSTTSIEPTYSWTGPNAFTSSLQNPSIPSATSAATGTYSVTVTSAAGCLSLPGTINIIVNPTPATPIVNGTTPVCSGTTLNLSTTSIEPTYSWTGPNTFTSTIQNPSIPSVTIAATGTYSVTVSSAAGCLSLPGTVDITVNPTPLAPIVPSATVCFGMTTSLTAGTSGDVYEWYDAPSGTLLGTGTTYTTPALFGATTYYVQSNTLGCIGPMTLATVTVAPSILANAGVDDSICAGGNYTLGVTPSGAGYTYTWDAPGMPGFSTSATPNVSPTSPTTTYTVTVSDALGCTGTDVVTITIGSVLTLSATGAPANCFGSCDGTGTVAVAGSFGGYNYNWSNGSTTQNINSLCAATYTIIVTDMFGCTAQDTIQVIEPTPIALTISALTSHCNQPDGSATVVAAGGVGGFSYLWSNGQTTATAINLIPGSYCVTVTDLNGCLDSICITVPNTPGVSATITNTPVTCNSVCDGTATVIASLGISPYSYLWNNGQTTPTASALCAGTYTCTITDASGCTVTASTTIIQPTIIVIDNIPPVTICIGQSTTLIASASGGHTLGGYIFNWTAPAFTGPNYSVSPTTTTTYTVTATDTAGCVSQSPQTVIVTVNPPLAVIGSANVSICPGVSTSLSAIASGGDGTYSYNWMPGAGSGSSLSVSPVATTTYTVTITDGCTVTPAIAAITVTVLPLPNISFNSNVSSGCEPICITFVDATTVAGGSVASWAWNFGNSSSSNLQSPEPVCYNAGTYDITLTAISNGGCSSTTTLNNMITIYPQPTAQFILGPQPATMEAPIINFTDLSINAVNWLWDFGDPTNLYESNTSNLINPSHIYADSGQYCVTLTVQSLGGCSDVATNCLTILPEYSLYIPNAFTPNGDGLNSLFAPKGIYIAEFTMRIFDRWGNLIFKSKSINEGWNGTVQNNNNIVQEDVYVYSIDVKDNKGKTHNYIGHVTIVK